MRDGAEAEVEQATAELAAAIRSIARDGGPLPSERRLAVRLGVKRHQLRKALHLLRRQGELAPPRQRRRSPPVAAVEEGLVAVSSPLEVIELRLLIEPSFARLASLRASAVEIGRILAAAATPEGAEPGEIDLRFHIAIAAASRNHLGEALYQTLRRIGRDARNRVAGVAPPTCAKEIARRDEEHLRVAQAIAARNPDQAEAAMRAHLLSVQARVMARSNPGS
jgi:DNA-binding FadR family transcriptional regulator